MNGWNVCIPWNHQEQREWWFNVVLAKLDFPTWYSYKFDQIHRPNFIPMLWEMVENEHFDKAVAVAESDIRPNPIWGMGNEPDRGKPEGTDTDPIVAAATVRAWLTNVDTRIAAPGLALDPGGLGWFDAYIAAEGPMPSVLTVHLYAYMPDDFKRRWDQLREWMHLRSLNMPVWITELGCTREGTDAQRAIMDVAAFTLATDEALERIFWFSALYGPYNGNYWRTDLFDADGNITAVGRAWLTVRDDVVTGQSADLTYLPRVSA